MLAQKLRDQQRRMIQEEFADLEDPVLTARVIRFERQSVIMAVSSGLGRPEVEAELPRRDQLPNDNYRANATFKVFLKEVSEVPRRGPQLFVSRSNAGLVVYLFENEVPEIQEGSVRIVAVAREANPPSRSVGPRTKVAARRQGSGSGAWAPHSRSCRNRRSDERSQRETVPVLQL